ncbi:multidrug ABC transporter permease [Paramagnetospirillum marisnigri]|uniref:Transport permease protein n=1 Tax=Paramagnetospirillum marisnigri TaxID=1285242 RepID=A0A178MQ05_9PROT|nr:ABC transporter permease [Paramagnetospirillum marisnigri]OAN50643.1 multidrug ABC transporter permease [Paramagnetospirillum marisnigri]
MSAMTRVTVSLAKREFTRFIRQPQRVVGTVAQPLLFWLFLGAGFGGSFRPAGMENVTYLEYFYPGVMLMMMLFASIFSSITIIEDRDAGFLQGVLAAPVPRLGIVLGKVLGSTSIALVQTLIFTIAAPFLGLHLGLGSLVLLLMGFVLTGIGFSALGFLLAWGMKSTSAFHAVMMVFLMPLWMLSGALFPLGNVPAAMKLVMLANPVSHALIIIRAPFYGGPVTLLADPQYLTSLAVTIAWAATCLGLSMIRVEKREKGVAAV